MLITITQWIGASISWFLLKFFADFKVTGTENLKELSKPFVLVSNHESYLDPQLLGVAILYKPSLFPLRYMAKNELFRIWGLNIVIWLLGAFKAHRGQGIGKSLLTPTLVLEKKGSVIIFPEGHPVRQRPGLGEGRRGAAVLALFTRSAILPVSVHTPHSLTPLEFLFTRPKVEINIGAPFYLNNTDYPDYSDENTYKATKVIMDKIGELYFQHDYNITERRIGERRGN